MFLAMFILVLAVPIWASQVALELEQGANLVFVTVKKPDLSTHGIRVAAEPSHGTSCMEPGDLAPVTTPSHSGQMTEVFSLPITVLGHPNSNEASLHLLVTDSMNRSWEFDVPVIIAPTLDSKIEQNVPNPFNPSTEIAYGLSSRTAAGPISLSIYNALGQRIRTLVSETQLPGNYSVVWDGTDDEGRGVSSGTYFYRLVTADFVQTRRMSLVE